MHDIDDIAQIALDWHTAGRGAVIATVIDTWGSAPRPVGSQLVIDRNGAMEGSVSGGCVEGAVIVEAIEALDHGTPKVLSYGVSDDDAFAVGLGCGGTIRILVEPVGVCLPTDMLSGRVAARKTRQVWGMITNITTGAHRVIEADEFSDRRRRDQSGLESDGATFVAIHNPPVRLAVIGAVHIAQPLVQMARLMGHDVTVIDPRPAFAASARFPGERICEDWPDEALTEMTLDARTAVVTLSHDPKIDDPAIETALASDVFYIGALGSTRTHAKRVGRLTAAGHTEAEIARIHGPVGLNLGGRHPAEIAVSILAEMTRVLRDVTSR